MTALKNTYGWVDIPDLIDANDTVDITGYKTIRKTNTWDSTNSNNYFYFETRQKSYKSFYNQTNYTSPYWWLYDRIGPSSYPCTSYECQTASGGSNYGYWTKTTVGTAGSGSYVWFMSFLGNLDIYNADSTNYGVRPVMTVDKSKL